MDLHTDPIHDDSQRALLESALRLVHELDCGLLGLDPDLEPDLELELDSLVAELDLDSLVTDLGAELLGHPA